MPTNKQNSSNIFLPDAKQTKKDILDLWQNFFVETLKFKDSALLTDLNHDIIDILMAEKNFKNELLQILFANQEKLTYKTFILNGQPARPTVANWLKDFIKQNGTGLFSNLVLSKYLTNSPNAKELSFAERRLVGKLLNTYRNLKFFPQSLANRPPAEWEIIPVASQPEAVKAKTLSGPKVKPEDVIAEFDKLIGQYPAGSLERKAIEEEKKRYIKKYEEIKRNL